MQGQDKIIKTRTIWTEYGDTAEATKKLKKLFDEIHIFDYPKPVRLIKKCLELATKENDIILDFFAGSGTTGEAVMRLNSEDGGQRKFILVQLDEPIEEGKPAYQFFEKSCGGGVKTPTIFDITPERLIRASKKIREGHKDYEGDLGFKIFLLNLSRRGMNLKWKR